MEVKKIVEELEQQISRLKQARALLSDGGTIKKRRGRPPGKSAPDSAQPKRRLSAAGRRRISEALKRRWAQRRKAAEKPAKTA